MKTKIFSLILIFALSGSMAFSQETVDSKTSIAIIGGVNFQNLNGKNMNGDKLENDLLTGFHVGLNALIPVAPEFYFQPGLMFSTKGARTEGAFSGTYKLSYIELPLNFVYKAQVGNGYFLLGFGPYLAYGVGGKATYEVGPVSVETDIEFKNEIDSDDLLESPYENIKPFDAGANIFFGYELPTGLFVQLNTQLGFLDIKPENNLSSGDDESTLKNTGYGLSLGYRF